nr:cobyric acid synthase [Roseburia inulinivorans]
MQKGDLLPDGIWITEQAEQTAFAGGRRLWNGDRIMAKVIMVQGTMSNAGKSLIVAGLCRIFKQDGYRVAPFKSQNMALNSFITKEGLEMGRAQVMQAEAAGVEPVAAMNPILLKPTTHVGSQVIVNGEVLGNMSARDYFAYKKQLIPEIKKAFRELEKDNDIIVIEGAGSPAEINLRENDIVNMGLAELLDAPVLLVGDIDRGGVFAQLLGTLMLLEKTEKERVKGLIINKFRGDKTILDPGVVMLEERGHVPVVGVVPYMELSIDDEDSLSSRFDRKEEGLIDIAVIRYPRISNFTDLSVLEQIGQVSVRYVDSVRDLHHPDMIVLPGSKNTMADLKWMRENGLEALIKKKAQDTIVFGICGGYQMLGETISDPYQVENGGSMKGMGLLPAVTELKQEKTRTQVTGTFGEISGALSGLSGKSVRGYEIHMGSTGYGGSIADSENVRQPESRSDEKGYVCRIQNEADGSVKYDGIFSGNVYGTYVHGIFDEGTLAETLVGILAARKGVVLDTGQMISYGQFKQMQYDKLADGLRESMDMEAVYAMLREAAI